MNNIPDDELIKLAETYIKLTCEKFDSEDVHPDELLSVVGAARLINVDRSFIEKLLLDPKLPRIKADKKSQIKIPKRLFLKYICSRSENWYMYNN